MWWVQLPPCPGAGVRVLTPAARRDWGGRAALPVPPHQGPPDAQQPHSAARVHRLHALPPAADRWAVGCMDALWDWNPLLVRPELRTGRRAVPFEEVLSARTVDSPSRLSVCCGPQVRSPAHSSSAGPLCASRWHHAADGSRCCCSSTSWSSTRCGASAPRPASGAGGASRSSPPCAAPCLPESGASAAQPTPMWQRPARSSLAWW